MKGKESAGATPLPQKKALPPTPHSRPTNKCQLPPGEQSKGAQPLIDGYSGYMQSPTPLPKVVPRGGGEGAVAGDELPKQPRQKD